MPVDVEFALDYFRGYLALLDDYESASPSRDGKLIVDDIVRAEPTLRRVLQDCDEWMRSSGRSPSGRAAHRQAILRAQGVLRDREAVALAFAPAGPQLGAAGLHPWVWEMAAPLWEGKHYRQAVATAAGNLSLKVQSKLDRWDVADDDLMTQALSPDAPAPGKPRLRVPATPGRPFEEALQTGALFYARGVFSLLRNPATHNVTEEWAEQRALEALAAMSVLARVLDNAEVEHAD